MKPNSKLITRVCCGTLAAGGVVVAIWAIPGVSGPERALLAILLLLAGGLIFEVYTRTAGESRFGERLLSMRYAHSSLLEDIEALRKRTATLEAELEGLTQSASSGSADARVDKVIAEVKVLQSLVESLAAARAERDRGRGASNSLAGPDPAMRITVSKGRTLKDETSDPTHDVTATQPHPLSPETLARAAEAMDASIETRDAREPAGAAKPAQHVLKPAPFSLSEDEILDIAQEALREDRVDLVLQPIVTLPQRKRRYYECFSRLRTREGYSVMPEQYIALAEKAGFVTAIDNMLLFRCVQLVRKIRRKGEELDFFCNISGRTLADDAFLGDFIDFLEDNKDLAAHLIFELTQTDYNNLSFEVAGLLDRLCALGCRLSLDQIDDLNIRPDALAARGVRFVKLTLEKVQQALGPGPDLIGSCAASEISIVAEKIEDEEKLREILDLDIKLAQGFLFSEPRLARPAA
jgi:cyclic-di-GMP phosphodiesterase TipF (flagellum assembly factor)